jgi:hypothetical protein
MELNELMSAFAESSANRCRSARTSNSPSTRRAARDNRARLFPTYLENNGPAALHVAAGKNLDLNRLFKEAFAAQPSAKSS